MAAMTHAQKKAKQRQRDKLRGWREITVRVGQEHVEAVRDFVASLPDPESPTDPRQLDLLDQIEREIENGDMSTDQPDLF